MFWLQLFGVIIDVEEVKVTLFVMSEFVGLGLHPSFSFEVIVVQELVAEDVRFPLVFDDELSSSKTTVLVGMRSRCVFVRGEQLEYDVLSPPSALLLDSDKQRFVIIGDVDEGLGLGVPEP
jgi:hypothetical protein